LTNASLTHAAPATKLSPIPNGRLFLSAQRGGTRPPSMINGMTFP